MKTSTDKVACTLRLPRETKSVLENIARLTKTSESQIAHAAISEYAGRRGFFARYVMTANANAYVLHRQEGEYTTVLDIQPRNGVPLQELRDRYAARFNSPVELVIDEEQTK